MLWLAFSKDTDLEAAKRRFQERFGYEPPQAKVERGLLLLGPIHKPEVRRGKTDDDNRNGK